MEIDHIVLDLVQCSAMRYGRTLDVVHCCIDKCGCWDLEVREWFTFVGCIEWMNKIDKDWPIGTLSTGNLCWVLGLYVLWFLLLQQDWSFTMRRWGMHYWKVIFVILGLSGPLKCMPKFKSSIIFGESIQLMTLIHKIHKIMRRINQISISNDYEKAGFSESRYFTRNHKISFNYQPN